MIIFLSILAVLCYVQANLLHYIIFKEEDYFKSENGFLVFFCICFMVIPKTIFEKIYPKTIISDFVYLIKLKLGIQRKLSLSEYLFTVSCTGTDRKFRCIVRRWTIRKIAKHYSYPEPEFTN